MTNNLHPTFGDILATFNRNVDKRPKPRRQHAEPGACKTCDAERQRNNTFFPPHDASPRCESGKRPHCTCDACF